MHTTYQISFAYLLFLSVVVNVPIEAQTGKSIDPGGIPISYRFESFEYNGGMQCWSFDQDSSGVLYVANNNGLLEFDGHEWKLHVVPSSNKVRVVCVDSRQRIFVGGQGQIGYFEKTRKGLEYSSLMGLLPEGYKEIAETWKIFESDSNIYFSTESQLLEYNGSGIVSIDLPGFIVAAFKSDGKIWVQILQQGIFNLFDGKLIPLKNTIGIPPITEIYHDNGRKYFFCINGDIYRYQNNNSSILELSSSITSINYVLRLQSGNYVIGTHNDGMYILDNGFNLLSHYTKNRGLSDRTVRAVYEDEFNNLWIALNNGIEYMQISLPFSIINDKIGLEGTGYTAKAYHGEVYLGTNNGLFTIEAQNKYQQEPTYNMVPGTEGQVYNLSLVGGEMILNHHNGAFTIRQDKVEQFHNIGSWKVISTAVEGLWLEGDYRGFHYFGVSGSGIENNGPISDFNESSRLFEFDTDTTLWMTHGSKGAFRFVFDKEMNLAKEVKLYGEDNGFPSNYKISLYKLNNDLVFTSENGVFDYNPNTDRFVPNAFFNKWLGTEHVSSMASDENQSIYYIQNQRLGKLKHESFGHYSKDTAIFRHVNKLLSDDLPNISIIDKDIILIGGKEGFIVYHPGKENIKENTFNVLFRSALVKYDNDSIEEYFMPHSEKFEIFRSQAIGFKYAAPYYESLNEVKYSYRLLPLDTVWSQWSNDNFKEFVFLPSDSYTFQVKAINIYGHESKISSLNFEVIRPWFLTDIAIISYVVIGLLIVILILLYQQKKYDIEKSMITESKNQDLKSKDKEISKLSEESKKEIERLQNEKLRAMVNLKNEQLTTITMHIMNNNGIIQDALRNIEANLEKGGSMQALKRIIRSIEKNLAKNDSWDQFAYHFDQVHGDYLKNLSESNIHLSPREIKLAAFLRMNLSSKEISKLMNITVRSVELARHRLRKKLKLGRDKNLVQYLIDLDNK